MQHTKGWRTTEFWVTVATNASLVCAAASGALPPKYAAVSGALATAFYTIGRSLVKMQAGASDSTPL